MDAVLILPESYPVITTIFKNDLPLPIALSFGPHFPVEGNHGVGLTLPSIDLGTGALSPTLFPSLDIISV